MLLAVCVLLTIEIPLLNRLRTAAGTAALAGRIASLLLPVSPLRLLLLLFLFLLSK